MKNFVKSEIRNHIAIITFGTEKSNAMPINILEKLAKIILIEGQKKEVKAILLQSAGEKAFCAGASFDELLQIKDINTSKRFFGGFAKLLNAMKNCGKIVVVRVQGKAVGGGVGIVCAADYCFATEQASLALTEINLGIGPFVISPYVERKIGKSQLIAMSLDTQFRSPQWAMEHNIYHSVSQSIAEMDTEIEQFMMKLSTRSEKALEYIKQIAWEGAEQLEMLVADRIMMSASLTLEDFTKESIQRIHQSLKKA